MTIPPYLKSKTVLFAILLAALSVLQGYLSVLPMTPMQQMVTGLVLAAIITVLRIVTTQPLADK